MGLEHTSGGLNTPRGATASSCLGTCSRGCSPMLHPHHRQVLEGGCCRGVRAQPRKIPGSCQGSDSAPARLGRASLGKGAGAGAAMCPPGTPEEPQGRPQEAALPAPPIPLRGHSRHRCLRGPGEWLGGLQISGAQDALAKLGAGQSIWGQGRRKQPLCPGREALLLPPGGIRSAPGGPGALMSPLQRRLRSAWRERACCAGEQPRGWAGSPPGLSFPSSEIVTDCSLQGRGDDTEPTQHIRPPTLVLPALRWLPGAALPACPSRPAALFTRHGAGPGRTRPVRGAGGALLDHVPSLWRSLKSSLAAAWSPLL